MGIVCMMEFVSVGAPQGTILKVESAHNVMMVVLTVLLVDVVDAILLSTFIRANVTGSVLGRR